MSLRDYVLLGLWGHVTITLWNYDSLLVWYHETMTTLMLWLLWCLQTMILWYYEAIRLWASATMEESMRVRKSKNRRVLKDSETMILGFYKTMILWVKMILYLLLFGVCVCMLSVISTLFADCRASPFFLASFLHSSEEDQRTTGPREGIPGALKENPGNTKKCKLVFQECFCPQEKYLFSSIFPVRTVPKPMFPKHLALLLLFCIPLGGCHGVESSQKFGCDPMDSWKHGHHESYANIIQYHND